MSASSESVLFSATALLLAAMILVGLIEFVFPVAASAPDQQVLHARRDAACPATAEGPASPDGVRRRS